MTWQVYSARADGKPRASTQADTVAIQNGTGTSLEAVHPVCLSPCAWKASTPKYVVALPFLVGLF